MGVFPVVGEKSRVAQCSQNVKVSVNAVGSYSKKTTLQAGMLLTEEKKRKVCSDF
jgi:hypothetical protein